MEADILVFEPPAAAPERVDVPTELRENTRLGYRFLLPQDWTPLGEQAYLSSFGNVDEIAFELPKVWSAREREHIANALSVTVLTHGGLAELGGFQLEYSSLRPELPSAPLSGPLERTVRGAVERQGVTYEVQLEFSVRGRRGYVLAFLATPGTFELNYAKFRTFADSFETFETEWK